MTLVAARPSWRLAAWAEASALQPRSTPSERDDPAATQLSGSFLRSLAVRGSRWSCSVGGRVVAGRDCRLLPPRPARRHLGANCWAPCLPTPPPLIPRFSFRREAGGGGGGSRGASGASSERAPDSGGWRPSSPPPRSGRFAKLAAWLYNQALAIEAAELARRPR